MLEKLSILKDTSIAFKTGKVHAMHDLTEGGVVGCTLEMSLASKLGFELYAEKVPIDDATKTICAKLEIDPLKLIGSGSVLISCSPPDSSVIKDQLEKAGIPCNEIGRFHESAYGRWIVSDGKRMELKELSVQDELWPALSKYGNLS